ncbi:MAG: glycosyltransferase [Saprospiraceae bacterium]|nr:glycosyltransferase [Saprospiraceae bacterium]
MKHNILHLCTTDAFGAGSAALRLHQSFIATGFQSHVFTLYKLSDDPQVSQPLEERSFQSFRKWVGKVKHELLKRFYPGIISKYSFFNFSESERYVPTQQLIEKLPFTPDVIIVHFISRFLNVRNIYELQVATGAKVVYTMMDMAPLTGGCHYAWQCSGYLNNCGTCPAISSKNPRDISYQSLAYKKQYLDQTDAHLLVCSTWSERQGQQSTLFKNKPISRILLPVNEQLFKPGDKLTIRKNFGLPQDGLILLVGSFNLHDERKGFDALTQALEQLYEDLDDTQRGKLTIVSIGKKDIAGTHSFKSHHLGLLRGEKALAEAYQLADVFACPSVEDAGPMMINESVLCGTPVVSFEMGVSLDLVHYPETGYRARLNDAADFAKGLKTLFFEAADKGQLETMRANCRELGLLLSSQSTVARQWQDFLLSLFPDNDTLIDKSALDV